MRKVLLSFSILSFVLLFSISSVAQLKKGIVKAHLLDAKTRQPIELASISIALAKDSTIIRSSVSDKTGMVEFGNVGYGSYRLIVSQLGLKTLKVLFALSAAKPALDFGDIEMETNIHNLKEVSVNAEKAPVTLKKDTVEFNAGSYKTQINDNVEQLLKKLPGVEVDKDGKVTMQGKEVKKILVDGKEFFGNDPKAITKNLPADAIDKVQVIDDKTDHAKNTGIDDGQRDKVLNVTLKEEKKHGWFGNASAAGGTQDRYLGQFNFNHFNKKTQLSFLFLSNNINETGFTLEDLNNFTGGDTFGAFASSGGGVSININSSGRADINGAFSGVSGGLITNHTGGVNYSDEWGKKGQFKFNSSLIAVVTSNYVNQFQNTQDIPNNLITDQNSKGNNSSYSYRLNMNFNYKPDTLNSFTLKPNISINHRGNFATKTYTSTNSGFQFINSGNQALDQAANTPSFGGQLTINHKFSHGKGSINFFTTDNYNINNSNYTNQSFYKYIKNANPVDSMYNQQNAQDNNSTGTTSTLSLAKPLSLKKKLNLSLSQGFDYHKNNADQLTLQYNPVNGKYDILAQLLSGNYANDTYKATTTLGFNKSAEALSYNFNAEINNLGLHGVFSNNGRVNIIDRNDWAVTPNFNLSYRKKNGYSIYVGIREFVTQPSVNDLQPVFNNTNPLYIRQGNPNLRLSNTLSTNISYNKFDLKTNTYTNFYANFGQTWDGFSTASLYDPTTGIQTSMPINTSGNFNSNVGLNIGKPTKVKGLKLSYGLSGQFTRTVNNVNHLENAVLRLNPNINLGVNYDTDNLQLGARTYTTYNTAQNTVQHAADQKYFVFNNNFTVSIKPVKTLRLFSELNQNIFTAQPNNPGQSVYLLNAGADQYFMKNQLTLTVSGFDLLKQNAGLQRQITQTGQTTSTQTNTLGQYFYLKLTYKLSKVGTPKATTGSPIIIMR
jgi:hypothetical protein